MKRACDDPALSGKTYRDIIEHALDLKKALEECSERVQK